MSDLAQLWLVSIAAAFAVGFLTAWAIKKECD